MSTQAFTRRNFLRAFQKKKSETTEIFGPGDDPLFDKYARKSLGTRYYSEDEVVFAPGVEPKPSGLRVAGITSGLAPYVMTKDTPWGEREALHLLRRTNFGWKKAFVDTLSAIPPSAAVDMVLQIDTTPPSPPLNWYQNILADEGGLAYGDDWTQHAFATGSVGGSTNHYRMDAVRRRSFGLAVDSDITIREKMVWFWFHLIPIDFESIYQSSNTYITTNCARLFHRYMKLFRDNALGNYKTLIRAIATEPAMMYYLNNQANTATAPDENFGRELMELFTLGKGPASQYTQEDVIAAAKVLTGWRVQNLNTVNVSTNFLPQFHSTANKQFSSFFGNKVIAYQASANGAKELDELIDMIFSKNTVVAEYICRRLYRYFVYYDIDANIEANVIVPLAQTFISNNWNILPVMKQLLNSEHFFDMANRGVYIKSPFDLVAGTLSMFAVNTTGTTIENQYRIWGNFNDTQCNNMDQRMGSIPNVSGWNAYYQTPAYHEYWINSNTVQRRFKFIQDMFNGFNISGTSPVANIKINVIAFAQQFGTTAAADPDLLTDACVKYLLPLDLSLEKKNQFKTSSLLGNQTDPKYWTTAWTDYLAAPTNTTKKNLVETRLKTLLSGLCQLAEFQLM